MPGLIIVGAGPLIGTSVARRFARAGMPVAVIARTEQGVDKVVAEVRADGGQAVGVTADAADEAGLRAALDTAVRAHGVPEVLVYNAAVIRPDTLGELSATELLDTLAVNVVGALTTASHIGPRMGDAGHGTIVITGGMPQPKPAYVSLSLGKAGVRTVADLLARQFGPSGVHVATVTVCAALAPGTAYDPDDSAEEHWTLHGQPRDAWAHEVVFAR
jgi:NAD(P)-dependent dehydrogenase (short-subunit alcohol dehydrogenase family)